MHYIPMTDADRQRMLAAIGVSSFDELISHIPDQFKLKGLLNLPKALSEYEATRLLRDLSERNTTTEEYTCFLGAGAYDHFVPAAVDHILLRSEFYTAYTPYQAEVSQGTLQAIYEYQTLVCELTAMDVANASMYDGASALAEAALMAVAQTRRPRVVVASTLHPLYREVLRTYTRGQNIEVVEVPEVDGTTDVSALTAEVVHDTACVLIQHPNFYGVLEDVDAISQAAHEAGALLVTSNDPISLGVLKPPGAYGTDIATGEGQPLGIPLSFGGPYLGLFAVKQNLVRRMPGRLIGMTVDTQGRRGFVMTLQTREQHIRREKATSNICTNQGLLALAATVHLALLGKQGFRRVAEMSLQKSHYLAQRIAELPGFQLAHNRPFFKEFVVRTPIPAEKLVQKLLNDKIFAGVPLSQFYPERTHDLLVAVTEKRTREEMDRFVEVLKRLP